MKAGTDQSLAKDANGFLQKQPLGHRIIHVCCYAEVRDDLGEFGLEGSSRAARKTHGLRICHGPTNRNAVKSQAQPLAARA
jgi:hypothetical protein